MSADRPAGGLYGHQGGGRGAALRRGAAGGYLAANAPGFAGPLTVQAVQGRPVEPDLYAGDAGAQLRAAPQAARQAAAVGARGRPRVQGRSARCTRKAFRSPSRCVYCADESVTGTAFYVMGFVDGRVIWEPDMPGSNPAERTAVYDAMNATLARLHPIEPSQIGLGDFGRGENYVARQVDRWSKQYRASRDREDRRDGAADGVAARRTCRRRRRCGWCTATTGSTT